MLVHKWAHDFMLQGIDFVTVGILPYSEKYPFDVEGFDEYLYSDN